MELHSYFQNSNWNVQEGIQVLLLRKVYFSKDPEGVQHFQGGSSFFQGEGVQILISIEPHLTTGAWSSILISPLNPKTENSIMSLRSDIVSFWFWGYRGVWRIELQAPVIKPVIFGGGGGPHPPYGSAHKHRGSNTDRNRSFEYADRLIKPANMRIYRQADWKKHSCACSDRQTYRNIKIHVLTDRQARTDRKKNIFALSTTTNYNLTDGERCSFIALAIMSDLLNCVMKPSASFNWTFMTLVTHS